MISLVPFRIFRIFSKPVTGQELLFAISKSKPALVISFLCLWIFYQLYCPIFFQIKFSKIKDLATFWPLLRLVGKCGLAMADIGQLKRSAKPECDIMMNLISAFDCHSLFVSWRRSVRDHPCITSAYFWTFLTHPPTMSAYVKVNHRITSQYS